MGRASSPKQTAGLRVCGSWNESGMQEQQEAEDEEGERCGGS